MLKRHIQLQHNVIAGQFERVKWGLNWVHYVHGAERGEIRKRKSSVKVWESWRTGIPVLYEGCYRSSCCVYYINMYFSFFSVKVCVKCINKFRLVYFEFHAQCCLNGVKGSKKAFVKCVCTLYKSPLTLNWNPLCICLLLLSSLIYLQRQWLG